MSEPPPKDITQTWEGAARAEVINEVAPERVLSEREQKAEQLKHIEQELFEKSFEIVDAATDFFHFESDEDDAGFDHYVAMMESKGYTHERAVRRARAARAAWKPLKDSPVAFKMAQATMVGILKMRSAESQSRVTLNIGKVYIGELPLMERKELTDEND